jgi:hypothetical protein
MHELRLGLVRNLSSNLMGAYTPLRPGQMRWPNCGSVSVMRCSAANIPECDCGYPQG